MNTYNRHLYARSPRYKLLERDLISLLNERDYGGDLWPEDSFDLERDAQRVCIAVCQAAQGFMTAEYWETLDQYKREEWLINAIKYHQNGGGGVCDSETQHQAAERGPDLEPEAESRERENGTPSQPSPPPAPRTHKDTVLEFDLDGLSITLNGKRHDVLSGQAILWVQVLYNNRGKWMLSKEVIRKDDNLNSRRFDKLKSKLPDEILALIESSTKHGYRFAPLPAVLPTS